MTSSKAMMQFDPLSSNWTRWSELAAAPTFAAMACGSAIGAPGAAICSATAFLLPIDEMVLMYLLMSIFHLSPWIRLFSALPPSGTSPETRTEGN